MKTLNKKILLGTIFSVISGMSYAGAPPGCTVSGSTCNDNSCHVISGVNVCFSSSPNKPSGAQIIDGNCWNETLIYDCGTKIEYECPNGTAPTANNPAVCEKLVVKIEPVSRTCAPASFGSPRISGNKCLLAVNPNANYFSGNSCYHRNYWPIITAPDTINVDELSYFTFEHSVRDPDGTIDKDVVNYSSGRKITPRVNGTKIEAVSPVVRLNDSKKDSVVSLVATDNEGKTVSKDVKIIYRPLNSNPVAQSLVSENVRVTSESIATISFKGSDTDGILSTNIKLIGEGSIVSKGKDYVSIKAPVVTSGEKKSDLIFQITDSDGVSKIAKVPLTFVVGKDYTETLSSFVVLAKSTFLRNKNDKYSYRIETGKILARNGNVAKGNQNVKFTLSESPVGLKLLGVGDVQPGNTLNFSYNLGDTGILSLPLAPSESGITGKVKFKITIDEAKDFVLIKDFDGVKKWDDGSIAKSCLDYRIPSSLGYVYGGEAGNGFYSISVNGSRPIRVYCDMETNGGGWTRVVHKESGSYETTDISPARNLMNIRGNEILVAARGTMKVSNTESTKGIDLYGVYFESSDRQKYGVYSANIGLPVFPSSVRQVTPQYLKQSGDCFYNGMLDERGCADKVILPVKNFALLDLIEKLRSEPSSDNNILLDLDVYVK